MESTTAMESYDHNDNREGSRENNTRGDVFSALPVEMCFKIVTELDITSVCQMSQTSKEWNDAIDNTEWLWKLLCLHHLEDETYVQSDREEGYSWKETFKRNYGYTLIKRHWLNGAFSNITSYGDLPACCMCPMDVETWGQILELELCR